MTDALSQLTAVIAGGLPVPDNSARPVLEGLFGGRYHKRHLDDAVIRDAMSLAVGRDKDVPFAGLVHGQSTPSGVYGGASVVWFPTPDHGSLITFVVGTGGLSPDEGLLTRPGHRRRVAALRRYLTRRQVAAWTKPDPTALGVEVPKIVEAQFPGFEQVLRSRYSSYFYAIAKVPQDPAQARTVVQAFFDLYAYERGWRMQKEFEPESTALLADLRADLFPPVDAAAVHALLQERRFVILQGPPGSGKTRLALEVRERFFHNHGDPVQFHPAVTYEDFIVGLSPDPAAGELRFQVRPGWLVNAAQRAQSAPYLLIIDEINRADLGKVLGEAIYLFEPREVGGEPPRTVTLPHPVAGSTAFRLPENLYVLGTMNTADRSIARLDLAIRRRFAFVTVPPDAAVIASLAPPLALAVFAKLLDVFVEHAPDDALTLLPGHSYFLAKSESELRQRFRYELLPLLDEYLHEGLVGSFAAELQAVRDAIEDVSEHGHWPG